MDSSDSEEFRIQNEDESDDENIIKFSFKKIKNLNFNGIDQKIQKYLNYQQSDEFLQTYQKQQQLIYQFQQQIDTYNDYELDVNKPQRKIKQQPKYQTENFEQKLNQVKYNEYSESDSGHQQQYQKYGDSVSERQQNRNGNISEEEESIDRNNYQQGNLKFINENLRFQAKQRTQQKRSQTQQKSPQQNIGYKINTQPRQQIILSSRGSSVEVEECNNLKDDSSQEELKEKLQQQKQQLEKKQYKNHFANSQNQSEQSSSQDLQKQVDESQLTYTYKYDEYGISKAETLGYRDLLTLQPKEFLNDTIINFYLKFLHNDLLDPQRRQETYLFNTYFMQKLCPQKVLDSHNIDLQKYIDDTYQTARLNRWAKQNLFEKKFIIIPVNFPVQQHWALFIIVNPYLLVSNDYSDFKKNDKEEEKQKQDQDNKIEEEEAQSDSSQTDVFEYDEQPCIIYLDSFGIINENQSTLVRLYLEKELQKIQPNQKIDKEKMRSYQQIVPRQINFYDCGLHLLQNVESFLSDPSYMIKNPSLYKNSIKLNLFPRIFIKKKRKLIRDIIKSMNSKQLQDIQNDYQQSLQKLAQEISEDDYDSINKRQFKIYLNNKHKGNKVSSKIKFQTMLEYYINPEINEYEC